tara:strand:+ start:218 stop:1252 length:1035 start_codon:yes stop_codon:yes gene_type:complete
MDKAVIFISFTNSQNQSIQNCIDYFTSCGDSTDFFLITNTDFLIDGIERSNTLLIKKIQNFNDMIAQVFYRKNKKHLENFTSKWPFYKSMEVLVPHFQNILSNHFLNYHINKIKYDNITVSLYPDGMLSYQPYKPKTRLELDSLLRWVGGGMVGMKYRTFDGPIADPFGYVKKIYSYIPSLTVPYSSKEIIKIYFRNEELIGENILILGHYKQSKFGNTYLKNISEMIYGVTKLSDYDKVYFKPHPRLNSIGGDIFYKSIQEIENLDTELCLDNRPVEKLIQSLGTTTIIASVSTSMINLKLKFKDQVSCYYFGLNKYVSSQYRSYYQKVFHKLSIKHLRESCD